MHSEAQLIALIDAMQLLLDDMGRSGCSVSIIAKAQARIAFEPFNIEIPDGLMPLREAERIMRMIEGE